MSRSKERGKWTKSLWGQKFQLRLVSLKIWLTHTSDINRGFGAEAKDENSEMDSKNGVVLLVRG